MQSTRAACLMFIGLMCVAGCAPGRQRTTGAVAPAVEQLRPAKNQLPSLESRLAADWISAATRIQAAEAVIYYRGSAVRASAEEGPWTGTVRGDVLFLSRERAVVIPSGALTLQEGKAIKVVGASRTVVAQATEPPRWGDLLAR